MSEKSILIPSLVGWAPSMAMAANKELPKVPMSGQIGLVDPYRLFAGRNPSPWNPSNLVGRKGLRLYDEMRRDEQIKAAIAFKKYAILAAGWDIVSPEGKDDDWEPRKFIDWSFDRLNGSMSDRIMMMLTSIEYGFAVAELVWGESLSGGPYPRKWPLEDIVALKPHPLQFEQDDKGHLLAVVQRDIGVDVRIPPEKVVLMTYQNEWCNPYGRSDFESCYDDWWGKTNTRKWLAMLLERFGIPPIFAMFNENQYPVGPVLDALKDVLTNLQAGTVATVPIRDPKDLTMWSPTLAAHVQDVFIPALDRYDRGMARGILMPNLMGATPEQQSGSFARALVNFDVFMFAVDSLRAQVEECINDQIIWRMMAVNYPTDPDEYPRFKFKPLTQDSRIELMDTWVSLVGARAVISREDDEAHIREITGFPAADSEPLPPPEPPPGLDGNMPPDKSNSPDKGKKFTDTNLDRVIAQVSQVYGKDKVDFKAIEKRLDEREQLFLTRGKRALVRVLTNIKRLVSDGLPYERISVADLWNGGDMMFYTSALEDLILECFHDGRRALAQEAGAPVPDLIFDQSISRVKPAEAIAFLKRKAITLTATLEDQIIREVRRVLIAGVETGMSTAETVDALAVVFEKWVGSDDLRDGGVAKPYRLESIARTETTSAYNAGRIVMARDPELDGLIRGLRHDSILDSRTTDICRMLEGRIHRMGSADLDALSPPLHFECRSILTPITISRQVDESEFITPSEVGRAKELAGSGFAGGGSF